MILDNKKGPPKKSEALPSNRKQRENQASGGEGLRGQTLQVFIVIVKLAEIILSITPAPLNTIIQVGV
jgi:hypothetical protein